MILAIAIVASLAAGFIAAFIYYNAKLSLARARLADAEGALAREREAHSSLETVFKGVSSDVLRQVRDEFMKQAEPKLAEQVRPLSDALKRYEEAIRAIEGERKQAYGGLKSQIEILQGFARELRDETGNLRNALKSTTARGRWGEVTLRRVAELAGMSEHCDFDEQVTEQTEDGALRPDMVVHIPGGRTVIVDAKTPLDAYLRAVESVDERDRKAHLEEHAKALREHMRKLSQKSYGESFGSSTDFVVMFVPGESFAAAALEVDRTLFEDGMRSKVILATPATLVAVLRSFAMGWQHEKLAENAQKISDAGKELFGRLATFWDHFGKIGAGLEKANKAFNSAVGSFESRVMPGVRRLKDLGATSSPDDELPAVEQVETAPHQIAPPDAGTS